MAQIATLPNGKKYIKDTWYIDDIKTRNNNLSDKQAEEVMTLIVNTHNSEVGINWEVIDVAIQTLGYNQ